MFSVVIPLYNKELSITNTVQSVLDQTYQNFEIVIINDGSTDSSIKAVEAINDNRIRLIHQENQGVSAARNRGIKEAKFEWIAFLDGDDLWEPNHLEEITKMMNLYPEEKVFVTSFVYSDNRPMFKHPRATPIFKIENYFKEAMKENLMWTSIVVARRNCLEEVGLFNISLTRGEDLDLWARIAKNFFIIKSTNATAIYRVEAENRTGLITHLNKTYVYYLDLKSATTDDELKYYNFLILRRMYDYISVLNFKSYSKTKSKHNTGLRAFFIYAVSYNWDRLIRLKNKVSKIK